MIEELNECIIAGCDVRIMMEELNEGIAGIDEEIAAVQSELDNVLIPLILKNEKFKIPLLEFVEHYENNIKLLKVRKMMLNAFKKNGFKNKNSKEEIFKHILAKFDELMVVSYDIYGKLVMSGIYNEGEYLDYCKFSLEKRESVKLMCCVGYGGNLE